MLFGYRCKGRSVSLTVSSLATQVANYQRGRVGRGGLRDTAAPDLSARRVMDGGLGFLDQLSLRLAEQTKLPVRPHLAVAESRPVAAHSCFRAVAASAQRLEARALLLSSLNHHAALLTRQRVPHPRPRGKSRPSTARQGCWPPRPTAELTGQIQGLCVTSMRPRGGSGSRERIIGTATSAVCWRHFLCLLTRTQAEHFLLKPVPGAAPPEVL